MAPTGDGPAPEGAPGDGAGADRRVDGPGATEIGRRSVDSGPRCTALEADGHDGPRRSLGSGGPGDQGADLARQGLRGCGEPAALGIGMGLEMELADDSLVAGLGIQASSQLAHQLGGHVRVHRRLPFTLDTDLLKPAMSTRPTARCTPISTTLAMPVVSGAGVAAASWRGACVRWAGRSGRPERTRQ